MFLKKMSRPLSKIPVSIRVTVWFTAVIIFLFSIVLSSAILLEDRYINDSSTEELVSAVEKIYEDPDEFENFDDGIYYIKYNENNEIIAGKIPKDFDLTLAFSIEDINTYQIENKKFLYYDTRLKNTGDWIRGIYPLSKFQNNISKIWNIGFYYIAPFLIILVIFIGYRIVKNAFKPVKKISETALEIKKSKNFSRRIELDNSEDEIHKMAYTFNEMLDTVEETFIHEKQFSSDVSHELRTPITVILAQSDYALDYVETLDEAKESFEVINRQAKKMTNLINQIMELSKMERQNKIEKDKINFSNIILQLLEDYRTLLENNNIELITNIEKDLRIYGNKLMLERLFVNLFTNAMKFTKTTINVSLNRINKEVILQIKDDGIGITKEDQKYIWDRFFQTSDSRNKDKNKGSGLGLSMVNRIVQLHSGTIELESEIDPVVITEPIIFTQEKDGKHVLALPYDGFKISYTIDFNHSFLKSQYFEINVNPEEYIEKISRCRTFAFDYEIDFLKKNNLALGGSLENAIVVGKDGPLNPEGLRYPDEFVRHKILDIIGDLYVLGRPLKAHVIAIKAGHFVNAKLTALIAEKYLK